jgi:hypothetical protein
MTAHDESTLTDGHVILCGGYSALGDGGGGTFKWDEASSAVADGGSVIEPDDTPIAGRFIRQLEGFASPELFGGITNLEINACLAAYGHAQLKKGVTYTIDNTGIKVQDYNVIDGDDAILQLTGDVSAVGGSLFSLISKLGSATQANFVQLRNLQIDCGFNAQSVKSTTIQAISIDGHSLWLSNLTITNFNCGTNNIDGVCVGNTMVAGTEGQGLIADGLRFKSPGDSTAAATTGAMSLIKSSGVGSWTGAAYNATYAKNVTVRNCSAYGFERNITAQRAKVRFVELEFVNGATITGNNIDGFGGPVIYTNRWHVKSVSIMGNMMNDVLAGLVCQVDNNSAYHPLVENVCLNNNIINIKGGTSNNELLAQGVWLNNAWTAIIYNPFSQITIQSNVFKGISYNDGAAKYPIGVQITSQSAGGIPTKISIKDNVFDIPDRTATDSINFDEAYSRCIIYNHVTGYTSGNVLLGNNKTPLGSGIYLSLADAASMANARIYPFSEITQSSLISYIGFSGGGASVYSIATNIRNGQRNFYAYGAEASVIVTIPDVGTVPNGIIFSIMNNVPSFIIKNENGDTIAAIPDSTADQRKLHLVADAANVSGDAVFGWILVTTD